MAARLPSRLREQVAHIELRPWRRGLWGGSPGATLRNEKAAPLRGRLHVTLRCAKGAYYGGPVYGGGYYGGYAWRHGYYGGYRRGVYYRGYGHGGYYHGGYRGGVYYGGAWRR